jgi:hypothetical protein
MPRVDRNNPQRSKSSESSDASDVALILRSAG